MADTNVTRRTIIGAMGISVAAASFGGIQPAFAQGVLTRAREEKTIRIGFANEAPYAFASPEGKLVGIMPDVIGAILRDLGIPNMEGVLTDFGGLIPGLLAGRFDILGAGLY